ncbi:IS4 family transposase, partial [Pseudomonas lactis]
MSIAQDLNTVLETAGQSLARLDVLAEHIPVEWIEAAATLAEQASIRRRRLPSDLVLWLVVGMAFFRGEPIAEVARRLNICSKGLANEVLLANSALSKARQRLGKEPASWLFQQCANVWGYERYPKDHWHELQVFAVDGALFRTQETPQLRDHFGAGNTSSERQTPYPVLRLVALMNVRSHVLANAAISPYRRGEIPLAAEFVEAIPAHSVTLLDKGFFSADLLLNIQNGAANRHWLIPERKGLVSTELLRYGDGDRLLQMRVSPQARKKNPTLPEHWQVRA